MSNIDIVENWLDPFTSDFIKDILLNKTPHHYSHVSVASTKEDSIPFYATTLSPNMYPLDFIFQKLKSELDLNVELLRGYINVQHVGMDGNFHIDDGDLTALYMVTDTQEKGSEFEYIDPNINEVIQVKFKQNTLIVFNSQISHRGKSTENPKFPRITLALKMKVL